MYIKKKIKLLKKEQSHFLCKVLFCIGLQPATATEALQEQPTMSQTVKRLWEDGWME